MPQKQTKIVMVNNWRCIQKWLRQMACGSVFIALTTSGGFAQNFQQVHDPSDPVFYNGRWYVYTTGHGIFTISKTSLTPTTGWRVEAQVFPDGFPEWITNYVPGFEGHFWAPHLTEERVYYSCSSFGSKVSAIGMAEGPPGGPYVDKGMVVFSNNSTTQGNAIDPYVIEDYLIYGSFSDGIFMVELGEDGKPATTQRTKVVDGGARNAEAAFMTKDGPYYYLWFNRGFCCRGLNSTYYVQVGRSTNITGPFLDRNGNSLLSGGGTTVLSTTGRYIGPGGSGVTGNTLVWHFYDGNTSNGAPRLMTGTISYINGWPCVTPAYGDGGDHCNFAPPSVSEIKSGDSYRITPRHALNKAMDVTNCGTGNGTNVRQWDWLNNDCQTWKLTYWDQEHWLISPLHATDKVLIVANASEDPGANVNQWAFNNGQTHEQWELIPRGADYYTIRNRNSKHCLEISNASVANGANLLQQVCDENLAHQHFFVMPPDNIPTSTVHQSMETSGQLRIVPNPLTAGSFKVQSDLIRGDGIVRLTDLRGKTVLEEIFYDGSSMVITTDAVPGIYILSIETIETTVSEKLVIK